ncbi:MAG: TolC family protein [Gemmatimonadetes bacterium]|nr:TolC family protein [Gemmatimonadota bacterium]
MIGRPSAGSEENTYMHRRLRHWSTAGPVALALSLGLGQRTPAVAQPPTGPASEAVVEATSLSLEQAVAIAKGESEDVRLARAPVAFADAQIAATRSEAFPQISGSLNYTRTMKSAIGGSGTFTLPDSLRFSPNSTAGIGERIRYLEDNTLNAALGVLGQLFGDLPFGQKNVYLATISASQILYSGGRVRSALAIADRAGRSVRLGLAEETAEIEFQVKTAYYQALLAQELATSAEEALAQADAFLATEQLRLSAGTASELDALRAEVSRDNLRPQLVQARNAAELALLNLKRLVDIPLTETVRLTTPLLAPPPEESTALRLAPDVVAERRAAVQAAQEQVAIRNEQIGIARAAFLPEVTLRTSYGRRLAPLRAFDFQGDWREDWTAGLTVEIPIFNGGRSLADMRVARIGLDQARVQLSQILESVQLQYQRAQGERDRAREAIAARQTTIDQAQRVYDLTVLRYEQGQATQLEVSQARLDLLNARANLAMAITDYFIADAALARALAQNDSSNTQGNG